MLDFYKLLSNREIAILVWAIIIFSILIFSSKRAIGKLWSFIRILFSKHFIPFYLLFGLYFFLIISLLKQTTIWEFSLNKDFIYWFLTTGIVLFFNSNKLQSLTDFTKVILTAISASVILEFIVGFYNFSLVWELIFIPFVTLISILSIVAEMKKEDTNSILVANILKNILSIIGLGILTYIIYKLITSYDELLTISNLKSFLLPPIFTFTFLPLIYMTVLLIKYERTFGNLNRYKFLSNGKKNKIKFLVLRYANINFKCIEKANKIILFNKKELLNEANIKSYLRENLKLKTN